MSSSTFRAQPAFLHHFFFGMASQSAPFSYVPLHPCPLTLMQPGVFLHSFFRSCPQTVLTGSLGVPPGVPGGPRGSPRGSPGGRGGPRGAQTISQTISTGSIGGVIGGPRGAAGVPPGVLGGPLGGPLGGLLREHERE